MQVLIKKAYQDISSFWHIQPKLTYRAVTLSQFKEYVTSKEKNIHFDYQMPSLKQFNKRGN